MSVLHRPVLIKRSEIQKDSDFLSITEFMGSNQGIAFLWKINERINTEKPYSVPLVISTKNPNAYWKPSNSASL